MEVENLIDLLEEFYSYTNKEYLNGWGFDIPQEVRAIHIAAYIEWLVIKAMQDGSGSEDARHNDIIHG